MIIWGMMIAGLIDNCFEWMCKRRFHHGQNQSIWNVRRNYKSWKSYMLTAWSNGYWNFEPTRFIKMTPQGEWVELWQAQDAWLIKTIAEELKRLLGKGLSKHCYHITGGHKLLLRNIMAWIKLKGDDRVLFVYKTDVRSYYQSIQHHILLHQLGKQGIERTLWNLIWCYLNRLVDIEANLVQVRQGVPKGCSLSPVLSALYLLPLDQLMQYRMHKIGGAKGEIFYGRFQDDWIILTTTRWALKRAIREQHEILTELKLQLRPEKTFIGYATKGFDFLGYHIQQNVIGSAEIRAQKLTDQRSRDTASGVTIGLSKATLERFQKKRTRLYEQKASPDRLEAYTNRFEI